MESRVNLFEKGEGALKALFAFGGYIKKSALEKNLMELIAYRVSQINGCAFCLDMHAKDARAMGETEQRLYALSVWRETSFYTDRERAALAWAEAVNAKDVPESIFDEAKQHFSDAELIDLTLAVGGTNIWNRLNIAFHPMKPGSYTVGQFG
jgi:AhpD family alkylhydroperoxidase